MTALTLIAFALAVATVIGCVYQVVATMLVRRFMQTDEPVPKTHTGVSVLKPLHGDELGLADNLRALCRADYPTVQIVCNTLDADDPAQAIAQRVRGEFPAIDMTVLSGDGGNPARNRKIASLDRMLPEARHPIVVFADADVGAAPHYLDMAVAGLEQPNAGIVTFLYIAQPIDTLWSALEALWINTAFLPSVLVARAVGRNDGCFGATIALHRETLEKIGGLSPLRDILADDFALGAAVRRLGLGIELATRPVEMVVHHADFASLFAHELRWGRTIAGLDRLGYTASILTQPLVFALAAVLVGGLAWPFLTLLAVTAIVRFPGGSPAGACLAFDPCAGTLARAARIPYFRGVRSGSLGPDRAVARGPVPHPPRRHDAACPVKVPPHDEDPVPQSALL